MEGISTGHRQKTRADINRFDAKTYFSWRFAGDEKGRYMILWGGDVKRKLVGIGSSFRTGKQDLDIVDVDGIPTTVMRCTERYERAVVGCTNVNDAYSYITHRFSECDVRWLFPELWMAWKNAKARLEQRRLEHAYREAKKHGTLKRLTHDERVIRGITQSNDFRSATRHYGNL